MPSKSATPGGRIIHKALTIATVVVSLGALSQSASAQVQAYLEPSGSFVMTLKGASDTRIGIPLDREPVFQGQVQSISGNTITVAGTPAWGASQWAPGVTDGETYQVLLQTGKEEGMSLKILNNGSNTIEVEPGVESLNFIATNALNGEGDILRIIPYHTPSSLFADVALPNLTAIFLYDQFQQGINKGPSQILTYLQGWGWIDRIGSSATDYPISRGAHLVARLPSTSADVELIVDGQVPMVADRYFISHSRNDLQLDFPFSITDPIGIPVGQSGFDLVNLAAIFVYDNESTAYNKGPNQILTYLEGFGWIDRVGQPAGETVILEPGMGYILRLPGEPVPTDYIITRPPSYLSE